MEHPVAFVHNVHQRFNRFGRFSAGMVKAYVATRVDRAEFDRIKKLSDATRLSKAEIVRRLIIIGLRGVKEVEDLLKL